jgi:hypothetical protein
MLQSNKKILFFVLFIILLSTFAICWVFGYVTFFSDSENNDNNHLEQMEISYLGKTIKNDLNQKKKETEIVVSLTTSPTRILLMQGVIESILKQTIPPTIIRLNLPRFFKRTNTPYVIPSFISNNPKVKIFWYDEDYGPIMKVLPTIIDYKHNSNVVVIYTDDDILFLPDTIETYLKFIIKDPTSVYCFSGFIFNRGNWKLPLEKTILTYVDIPEGFMSVAFQSSIFKNVPISLKKYYNLLKIDKACFGSDDLILGNFFAGNGIKVQVINVKKMNRDLWWRSGCELPQGNSGDGLKDLNEGGHQTAYLTCYNNLIAKGLNYLTLN